MSTEKSGPLTAGASSAYGKVGLAYRYASVEVYVGERPYVLQVIDYVGETPLPDGHFTYVLAMIEGRLELTFEES